MVSRTLLFYDIVLALVLIASSTLLVLLATALTLQQSSFTALGIAAAALNIVGFLWTLAILIIHASGRPALKRYMAILNLLVSLVASALDLVFLLWTSFELTDELRSTFLPNANTILNVEYGIWGLGFVLQFGLFVSLLQNSAYDSKTLGRRARDPIEALPEIRSQSPFLASRIFSTPLRDDTIVSSPTGSSAYYFDARSSTQSLVASTVPAQTLVTPTWFCRDPNRNISPTPTSPQSENISTMTQEHPSSERSELFNRPRTPTRTPLETIPGSTQNSPGRLLDKAIFKQPSTIPVTSKPRSTTRSRSSSSSSSSGETKREARVPPRFRRNSTPPTPPAAHSHTSLGYTKTKPIAVDESHIHPLFRTSSPIPPPTTTISTTVIASAFGGQALSPSEFSQASSRPGTPDSSGRVRAKSLTRPGARSRSGSATSGSIMMIRSKSAEKITQAKASVLTSNEEVPPLPNTLSMNAAPITPLEKPSIPGAWPLPE